MRVRRLRALGTGHAWKVAAAGKEEVGVDAEADVGGAREGAARDPSAWSWRAARS